MSAPDRSEPPAPVSAEFSHQAAYLHALHDASPDGFMLFRAVRASESDPGLETPAGEILDFEWRYANPAAARVVGRDPEALVGQRLLAELPGNRIDGRFDAYVGVVTTGNTWQREFTYQHEQIDTTFRAVAVRVDDGFAITFIDISATVRTESTLRATAARLRLLADAGRALGTTLERDRACTVVAELLVPRVADACAIDLVGGDGDWIRPATTATEAAYGAALPAPRPPLSAATGVATDPAPPLGSAVTVPILDRGQVIGVITVATAATTARSRITDDDTVALIEELSRRLAATLERVRLLTEAQTARRDAENANRAKSQFLATMSHELRTPLNAILGYADLLDAGIGGTLATVQQRYVDRVRASGRHLLGLIDDVLDFAKLEAGTLAVSREPAALRDTFVAAEALVRPQSRARGVQLDVAQPPSSLRYVGDEERVRQVLVNLLSNAIKFTPTDGIVALDWRTDDSSGPPTSHDRLGDPHTAGGSSDTSALVPPPPVRPAPPFGWLRAEVRDTGIGIPADAIERVFEPFVQVDASRTRTAEGTGLGLAISRQFATRMHGDLTVASEPGHGSVFALWLPRTAPGTAIIEPRGRPRIELGRILLTNVGVIVARTTARLRTHPLIPNASTVAQSDLENHLGTFLADLAQQFTILDDEGVDPVPLVRDGSELQHILVDKHGRQRWRLGWPEAALVAEFHILIDEIAQVVRADRAWIGGDLDDLVALLSALLDEALRASLVGYHAHHRVV